VTVTQQYVGQIHSRRNIEVRPLQEGYLEAINVREGQAVKAGDLLFAVVPLLYKARLAAEQAKLQSAQLQYDNTAKLAQQKIVSEQEVALKLAELNEAKARLNLAEAELAFTQIKAPFDGIIDRFQHQQGSLVKKEDVLTTLSDNSVMWVYFNVPEARYLEYMAGGRERESRQIELVLADGSKFPHHGVIGAIEAKFNNETGNIPFRADFPNPDGLLRHGQTGTVLIKRTLKGALVIPQRATIDVLEKRFVFVVGADGTVKQREIAIQQEQEDIFLVKSGLSVDEQFVLEGVRQVKDGDKVEYEYCKPEEWMAHLKYHAE
jgi:membrane fusion protein (multidrug efflux system)